MVPRALTGLRALRAPPYARRIVRSDLYYRRSLSSGRLADASAEASKATHASRLARFHSKLPNFLQRFTRPLLSAPLSHITSFLLLHEITAVVPLFGLAYVFHYTHYLPTFFSEWAWVSYGVQRFGRWFRKKGWLGNEEQLELDREVQDSGEPGKRAVWWSRAEGGIRWVVEFATAYAITKALLPLRLLLSVWATPWFARVAVIPSSSAIKRLFGRKGGKVATASKSPTEAVKKTGPP